MNTDLTHEQREAIETHDKPTLIFAGAGAGKTRVLVEKYLKLLESGLTPSQILCLTFTTDAAEEMKARLTQRLKERESSLCEQIENTSNIGTIHSFCYQVLNQFASEFSLSKVNEILDPFSFATQFEKSYTEHLDSLPPEKIAELLRFYNHTALHDLALELYDKRHLWKSEIKDDSPVLNLVLETFQPFVEKLEKVFYEKGFYSFDDLENLATRIFETSPLAREQLLNRFKAVLVDEFQDVSRSQWKLLREIALSHPKGLFLVGDPKQSIYGFRHSEPELFYEVSRKLKESQSKVIELTLNFRTHEKLLDRMNFISSHLFPDVEFAPMKSGVEREAPENFFHIQIYDCNEDDLRSEIQSVERDAVAERVQKLTQEGASPSSIVLLFRNADRMVEYQRSLFAKGISSSLTHTLSFSHSYEIQDLIAFLRVSLNPLDNANLAHFLRSPYCGFTLQELSECAPREGTSLYECLLQKAEPRLAWFFHLIESGETRLGKLLDSLFKHSDYFPQVTEAFLLFLQAKSKSEDSLTEFMTNLDAWKSHSLYTSVESVRENAARLMTVHAAKGLEFDYVFLCDNLRQTPVNSPYLLTRPGLGVGLRYKENDAIVKTPTFEKLYELQKTREQEEAKRILYVALTRAKKSLFLFLPKNLKKFPNGSWGKTLFEIIGN